MNSDILKSAADGIKAGEKSNSETRIKKSYKGFFAAASLFIMIGLIIIFSLKYILSPQKSVKCAYAPESIHNMFLYDSRLYYTDYKNNLYLFDSSSRKGRKESKIHAADGSQVFEYKGNIYYESGSVIYEKSLKEGTLRKLLTGQNLGIMVVGDGRLFYSIAYKDKNDGFSEFEYHIYDLCAGKDTVLFKRSNNMWHILDIDGDTVIADGYMPIVKDDVVVGENDSGTFSIDLKTTTYKKFSNMRAIGGCMAGGKFYYKNQSAQLYPISLSGSEEKQIQLPGIDKQGYMVDGIMVYGDTLYAGVHYVAAWHNENGQIINDEKSYITSINLETGKALILADASNRAYNLCTDGKTLYAYDANPYNNKGNIIMINLK